MDTFEAFSDICTSRPITLADFQIKILETPFDFKAANPRKFTPPGATSGAAGVKNTTFRDGDGRLRLLLLLKLSTYKWIVRTLLRPHM
jgi:hypothetical protein